MEFMVYVECIWICEAFNDTNCSDFDRFTLWHLHIKQTHTRALTCVPFNQSASQSNMLYIEAAHTCPYVMHTKPNSMRERCACVRAYVRVYAYDKQFNKLTTTKKSNSSSSNSNSSNNNSITGGHEFRTDPFRSWYCMFWFRLSAQKQEENPKRPKSK